MKLVEKIFGTHSSRELKRIEPIVDKIESLRPEMQKLSDSELRMKTTEFKKRLAEGETLDDLLPEAYAVVREAGRRVLNMEHFRVQLIGGIVLHQGRIAEMRTGEGKTLVSTLPAYLNALEGKGVQIVTVNDYLAKRDAEWMGQIHEFLGLKVGVILSNMTSDERREAYNCDITYVTNNELGFDYLRDNMVIYKEQLVLRGLHYCIIDEVDSVLIDEARTPLIISGESGKATRLYEFCDSLAKQMVRGEDEEMIYKLDAVMDSLMKTDTIKEQTGDFVLNEKDKNAILTDRGVARVEKYFHIENLADPENAEIQHNMILALRANYLMHRDQDYIVKDDQVIIVDSFTGRLMPGRRYSDGLHQAIEAKEHVKVKRESNTLATITFQNFFNKYEKKGGMTGTALTEEQEFRDIYGMDVISIPTNRPVRRIDYHDIEGFPEDADLRYDYIKALAMKKEFKTALTLLDQASQMKYYEDSKHQFLLLKAEILAEDNQYEAALEVCNSCIEMETADFFTLSICTVSRAECPMARMTGGVGVERRESMDEREVMRV